MVASMPTAAGEPGGAGRKVGVGVGQIGSHLLGVEDDEVGGSALCDQSPVGEPEGHGRVECQLADPLLPGEGLAAPDPVRQQVGRNGRIDDLGDVGSRVRPPTTTCGSLRMRSTWSMSWLANGWPKKQSKSASSDKSISVSIGSTRRAWQCRTRCAWDGLPARVPAGSPSRGGLGPDGRAVGAGGGFVHQSRPLLGVPQQRRLRLQGEFAELPPRRQRVNGRWTGKPMMDMNSRLCP